MNAMPQCKISEFSSEETFGVFGLKKLCISAHFRVPSHHSGGNSVGLQVNGSVTQLEPTSAALPDCAYVATVLQSIVNRRVLHDAVICGHQPNDEQI